MQQVTPKNHIDLSHHYQDAQQIARLGSWEFWLDSQQMIWTEEMYHLFEIPVGTPISLEQSLDYYTPTSRKNMEAVLETASIQGQSFDLELQLIPAKSKKTIWVRSKGKVIWENNKVYKLIGIIQNINTEKIIIEELLDNEKRWQAALDLSENELVNQKNLLQQILDSLPLHIFIKGREGRYSFVNDTLAHTLQVSKEEIIGKTDQELAIIKEINSTQGVEEKKGTQVEHTVLLHNTKHTFLEGKREIHLLTGQPASILTYALDITEKKQAEDHLRDSEQQLKEAQKLARLGSMKVNLDKGTGEWSDELYHILGLEKEYPYTGIEYYTNFIHPEDVFKFLQNYYNSLRDEVALQTEYRLIRPSDKKTIYVLGTCKVMRYTDGRAHTCVETVYDITELKMREIELAKAKEKAEEAALVKARFLSTMSHEIRTPLNAVIGVTHLLLQENPKLSQLKKLETLKFSAENLLVLINDILDFNKIEAGKIVFEKKDFSLIHLMESIRQAFAFKAQEKGVKLRVNIDSMIPAVLVGDPSRLSQILTNLVSNAIKFTDKGSVKVYIELDEETENYVWLDFSVKDTGIGISPEKQKIIFEEFSQAGADITRRFGGTGLGLAIIKRLLELQNSRVELESDEGKGTVFSFKLRMQKSTLKNIKANDTFVDVSKKDLKQAKILLVEDNAANQFIATQFLNKWNTRLEYANDGEEAVHKVKECPKDDLYRLILMDLQMPVMDGYKATSIIHTLGQEYRKIPILALTASVMLDVRDRVEESGMQDFIHKPFNPNDFYNKLAKHLSIDVVFLQEENDQEEQEEELINMEGVLQTIGEEFLPQFVVLNETSFQEFIQDYSTALHTQHEKLFKSARHKIQGVLLLMEFDSMLQEINRGKFLLDSGNKSITLIEESIEKIQNLVKKAVYCLKERAGILS